MRYYLVAVDDWEAVFAYHRDDFNPENVMDFVEESAIAELEPIRGDADGGIAGYVVGEDDTDE